MLKIQVSSPSPDANPLHVPSLADLSRNASVISSSSSSSSVTDLTVQTPVHTRPNRTFSSPRIRSKSPQSPSTPRGSKPPAYLARELGIVEDSEDKPSELKPPASRAPSRSRNSSVNGRISVNDFEFGRVLGEGSYSEVRLARNKNTGQEYAIKVLDKAHLKRKNKLQIALSEKNTLVRLGAGHPGIIRLHSAFQDEWSLFFVLDLVRNGDLQSRISRLGSFSTTCARYYAAQIVDSLDYMHAKGVIHRDLKPENLLLDDHYRIKITDFGTGKIVDAGSERAKTFVGTPEYVSPELLESNETTRSSDLWALGCIIYRMIAGRFAFQGLSEYLTLEKIKSMQYSFPEGFDEEAKDLVEKLLMRDPTERLGAGEAGTPNDMNALRAHPFFASITWATLWTDPAPPLEAGLVKREAQSNGVAGLNGWEDVGAQWDEMVDGEDGDGMSWASDGEVVVGGGSHVEEEGEIQMHDPFTNGFVNGNGYPPPEVGPLGETRPYHFPTLPEPESPQTPPESDPIPEVAPESSAPAPPATIVAQPQPTTGVRFSVSSPTQAEKEAEEDRDTVPPTLDDVPVAVRTQPIDVPPRGVRDSYSTGSTTSSSDGSPVEKLEAALEAAGLNRGRNRAQTPIQGNGPAKDEEWSGVLQQGENVIFNANVETSPLRRRASRILAIAVAPRRKSRELVLTDRRLICIKSKPGRHVVRYEFPLKAPLKEKEMRYHLTGVEAKGDKEFVVLTPSKSHSFIASSPSLASMWIRKIREAIENENSNRQRT
ncbi:hypothetical protein QCA50_004177 [Cerrena zonata]|uniref:non-specific serine/threonine protein kinase n=1 Tax=Cerrena zonata TaxID=2478898 RepID=A0AAW0GRC9_9APHY